MTTTSIPNSRIYTDFSAFAKLRSQARADTPAARKEVATQMESLFLQMMLKSMRKASSSGGLFDNDASKMYQGMMDQQLALVFAGQEPGLGLKQLILQQLPESKKSNVNSKSSSAVVLNKSLKVSKSIIQPESYGMYSARKNPSFTATTPAAVGNTKASNLAINGPEHRATFVSEIWPYAQKAAQELRVPAQVLVAQAALETGWGNKVPRTVDGRSSFNYFGIKAGKSWKGLSTHASTIEIEHGRAKKLSANFRVYPDPSASFSDYVALLKKSSRYQQALNIDGIGNRFADALQQAGYATDPEYANKIKAILESPMLYSALKNPVKGPVAEYKSIAAVMKIRG